MFGKEHSSKVFGKEKKLELDTVVHNWVGISRKYQKLRDLYKKKNNFNFCLNNIKKNYAIFEKNL